MDKIDWNELERIPIPEGLEERLSNCIDEWAEQEKPRMVSVWMRRVAVAACLAIVFGLGGYYYERSVSESENIALQDTFDNPEQAGKEVAKALNLLAYNLDRGVRQLERINAVTGSSEPAVNKVLTTNE